MLYIYMAILLCTSTINSLMYLTTVQLNGKWPSYLSNCKFSEGYLKSRERRSKSVSKKQSMYQHTGMNAAL